MLTVQTYLTPIMSSKSIMIKKKNCSIKNISLSGCYSVVNNIQELYFLDKYNL